MAYLRGDHYIWADGSDHLHIWVHDGDDGWREHWTTGANGSPEPGYENASGVSIPEAVMDEYVMMRFAELIASKAIDATIRSRAPIRKEREFWQRGLGRAGGRHQGGSSKIMIGSHDRMPFLRGEPWQ